MTNIISIETATPSCSVALRINGDVVVRSEVGQNIHSQVLLSMVESLLDEAAIVPSQLDAVAVGQGPGSFTGLRIGVGVGQGLAFGAGCPMIGVSSLDALAVQADGDGFVLSGTDARMGEVYWCAYRKKAGVIARLSDLHVGAPRSIEASAENHGMQKVILVGNAWVEYSAEMSKEFMINADLQKCALYPSAGALLVLAEEKFRRDELISPIEFAPIYVRNNVAKKSTKSLF